MSDDIYQREILQQARDETNSGRLEQADASATVDNPMCGDRVTVDLKMANGSIDEIAHHTRGCVLCTASAAILADRAKGRTPADIKAITAWLHNLLKGTAESPAEHWQNLKIFGPVAKHRSRHACVLLPFDAATKALADTKTAS